MIPVLHRPCKVPFRLRRLQYIDATANYDKGLAALVRMLGGNESWEGASASSRRGPSVPDTAAIEAQRRELEEKAKAEAEEQQRRRVQQERLAREKVEADRASARRLAEQAEQERMERERAQAARESARTVIQPALDAQQGGSSNRKYLIIASALIAAVVLTLVVVALSRNSAESGPPQQFGSSSATPAESTPSVSPASDQQAGSPSSGGTSSNPATPESQSGALPTGAAFIPDPAEWVKSFLVAGQGPEVAPLHQFFDDTVSPYFSIASAQWSDIERDKQNYFDRFPSIRCSLVGEPVHTVAPDGRNLLEYDFDFSETRKDGQALQGTHHVTLNIRVVDGQWKIAGITERKAK